MPQFPWLRLYTEIIDDRKLRRLPPAQRWVWIAVLCAARRSPVPGKLLLAEGVPVTLEDVADMAAVDQKEVNDAFAAFQRQNQLAQEDGIWIVVNWEKRQFASDDVSSRVKKSRMKNETLLKRFTGDDETLLKRFRSVSETAPESESESESDKEKDDDDTGAALKKNGSLEAAPLPEDGTPQPDLIGAFEREFGRPLSPLETEAVAAWGLEHSPELVAEALRRAVMRGRLNCSYVRAILHDWRKNNVRTLSEIQEHERRWAARSREPPADLDRLELEMRGRDGFGADRAGTRATPGAGRRAPPPARDRGRRTEEDYRRGRYGCVFAGDLPAGD